MDHASHADGDARRRANQLLRGVLTEAEYLQVMSAGYLDVHSPTTAGRVYRVPRTPGVVTVFEDGAAVMQICVRSFTALPADDVVALHKLLIEGNERAYLATANRFPVLFAGHAPTARDPLDFRGADLRWADLRGLRLQGADLRGANLTGAQLHEADLRGATLRDAVLRQADLSGAVLADADLRGCDLTRAVLRGADLRGASLHRANLTRADCADCDLRGAYVETAVLTSANFNGDRRDGHTHAADG